MKFSPQKRCKALSERNKPGSLATHYPLWFVSQKKTVSTYDTLIKYLFLLDQHSMLLEWLTGGVPVHQILNVEVASGRPADL